MNAELRERVLFWLLLALWVFNVCDFLLTREALAAGRAIEANGVMSRAFHSGTVPAFAFKIGVVTAGALLLWRFRGHHAVLLASALLASVFAAIVTYQALWVMDFS